jgi:O-succinylbenzoate synthase
VSASSRFYTRDIVTEPAVLEDGHVRVPIGHGLGVDIDPVALEDFTVARETLTR